MSTAPRRNRAIRRRSKWRRAAGFSFAINRATVLRGGYGLFFAPWNYSPTQHGQTGFSRTTSLNQSDSTRGVPITSLENPFPNGLQQPIGSSLGLLTGTGGTVNFVDQNKGDPKVHQYSVDMQRELGGNMAVTVGYVGRHRARSGLRRQ